MQTVSSTPLVQVSIEDDIHPEVQSCRDSVFTPTCTSHPTTIHPLQVSYTPGGSERWTRIVEEGFTPKLRMHFVDYNSAMCFYVVYAISCGFEPRLYTTKRTRDGELLRKSIVCNRQGYRDNKRKLRYPVQDVDHDSTVKPKVSRNVKVTRIGCPAMMRIEAAKGGGYTVDQFVGVHNHRLLSVKDLEFQKVVRKLSYFHKKLIVDHSKMKIGASTSFQLCKQYADGYSNVGATLTDFKNFARDIKCFIGLKDANLFITHFEELAKMEPDFYFAYELDEEQCLNRVFWADSESRKNYSTFGDAVSFDATYGTNKYRMIFTPFTGVDHHKRTVTFACSLLAHESEESYLWCFKKFLDCMGQKQPLCIITDQCPSMLLAIPAVFTSARHRFCMWHIMEKVSAKVGSGTCKDTDFLSRLNSVVWDSNLEPMEFDRKWLEVMHDFNLVGHKWLSSMFRDKHHWIPAYFRDLPMGGLLRTTQRSESTNSFYKRYENQYGTLVEFWMRFETAMQQQRYSQKCLDKDSEHSLPVTSPSPSVIELHAASVYTHKVFYDVQIELNHTSSCGLRGLTENGDMRLYQIDDELRQTTFQVCYTVTTKHVNCTCKLFESKGLLCRHIFWVFSANLLKSIPAEYILPRWSKVSYRNPLSLLPGNILEDCDSADVIKWEISKVWSEFYSTISVVKNLSVDRIKEFAALLKGFREDISPASSEVLSKEKEIEQLLGFTSSSEVTILPPKYSKNKGSGKRLLSSRKESIAKAQKPKRLCACCKQMANHDKRNCPKKDTDDETSEDDV